MNELERVFIDAMLFAAEGEDPSKAIELQEKRGQNKVVELSLLPKRNNPINLDRDVLWKDIDKDLSWEETNKLQNKNNEEWTKSQYEKMGIKIISEHDDLFYDVELPEGWKVEATDHSMWNNLYDDKRRIRANFFYKAAFYDRDAFINFNTRYHIKTDHVGDPYDYDVWKNSDLYGVVMDCGKVIYETEHAVMTGKSYIDSSIERSLRKELDSYMEEHYPLYKDINAYWD